MQQRSVLAGLSQFLSSPRLSPRVVVYGAASALLTGLVTVSLAAPAPSPAPNGGASSGAVQQRESLLAAQIAARNSGQRVEVTGLRTETATTYANPNGTTTTETAAAPIRVRDNGGKWTPVDLHLVASGGHYVPKAAAAGLTLSLGGNDGLVGLTRKGKHLSMKWSGALPQPTVDGATATYPDVDKNVDLVMQATRLGYGQSFRVKARPDGQLVYRLPLALPGITVTEQPDGGYKLTDSDGAVVGVLTRPLMWDAQRDPVTGDPTNTVPLEAKIVTSATGTVLQVKPDKAFLDNPTTQYPVTLDPDTHLGIVQDTWVASNTSVGYPTATDLRSGKYGGTGAVQRSFIQFAQLPPQGVIQSATLALYNNQSASCDSTKQTRVYQVASPGFSSSTNYANRPGVMSSPGYVTTTGSYAGTGCSAAGWMRWDVTTMVADWNTGGANYGFQILAADETDTANWKRYASADNGNNLYIPSLAVTYDNAPNTPYNTWLSPSVNYGGTLYTNVENPKMYMTGCDPDGGTVQPTVEIRNTAGTLITTNNANYATQCSQFFVGTIQNVLQTNTTYQWRAKTTDGVLESSWTGYQQFVVDLTSPPTPVIDSPTANGSSYTFTWSAPSSDTVSYRYGLDDQNPPTLGTTARSVTLPASDAKHTFHLLAVDRAGNTSPVAHRDFDQTVTTVTAPKDGQRTAKTVQLAATSRTGWSNVTFRYRRTASDVWTDIPSGSDGAVTDTDGNQVSLPVATTSNGSASPSLLWDVAKTLGRVDGPVLIQACFSDATGSSCSPVTPQLTLDQKALGDSYATTDLPPGTLSLVTGNLSVGADDVADGSGTTSLTVTRTFNTRIPNDPTSGMFGPGWLGSLPAQSADSDYIQLNEAATTATVTASDGSIISFAKGTVSSHTETNTAGSPVSVSTTAFSPTGEDAASGLTLTKSQPCNANEGVTCFTLTDLDANTTRFEPDAAGSSRYVTTQTTQPGGQQVTYTYSGGLLRRALAQPPINATCTNSTATADGTISSTWTAGCRALELTYESGHVTKVVLAATRPADGAVLHVDLSCYAYDPASGRLTAQWDPRLSNASGSSTTPPSCDPLTPTDLTSTIPVTRYSYETTSGRLTSVTPPGLAPYTITYDSDGRVHQVSRAHGTAGTSGTETSTVEYDLPLGPDSTNSALRPDLRPAAVANWGQHDQPVTATAVFGPADTASRTDLRDGLVSYIDVDNHLANTAQYASGWHIDTTEYDTAGHVIRTLTASNRELALNPTSTTGQALSLPTQTDVAASWLDTVNQYAGTPDEPGIDLLHTYGPYHQITLADGTVTKGREHTRYSYDSGNEPGHPNPGGGSLHLETRRTVSANLFTGTTPWTEADVRVTSTEYSLGTSTPEDNAGWALRQPMRITEDPDGINRVTVMRYDPNNGLLTQKWQPQASDSSPNPDAHKTRTIYYSAVATADNAGCIKAAWAKLPCRVGPIAQPAPSVAPPLPVTTYQYDYLLRPTTVTETVSNPDGTTRAQRITTTTYGNGGWAPRVATVAVEASGDVGTPVPTITRTYHDKTGLPATISSSATPENPAGTTSRSYDDFGRLTSYTDADGNTATSTYDPNTGRLTSRHNDRGTISYTYDGADEHRDIPTGMTVSGLSGTFSATYDADGQLSTQTYPNGMTQTLTRDSDQQLVSLDDRMPGQATPWLTDSVAITVHGQWASNSSKTGNQKYGYDALGRLIDVSDTPAATVPGTQTCTARRYSYDRDSNRLAKYEDAGVAGGECPSIDTTADQTQTHSYDAADRLLNTGTDAGLGYDDLGRIKALPAADADGSAVTNTFYANDLVRGQTSSAPTPRTLNWTLDPSLRPRSISDNAAPDGNPNKSNHYDDDSDSPSWIDEAGTTNPDGTPNAWTRYVTGLGGNLVLTETRNGGFSYQLTNLHGDIAAKVSATSSSGPDAYLRTDEFGNPTAAVPALNGDNGRYGWLGGKQRSTETAGGLTLMGVRLYAPTLGRFLQTDPVVGGSANAYDYANQDPINKFDLDGRWCRPKWACGGARKVGRTTWAAARITRNAPYLPATYVWAKAHGGKCKWATGAMLACGGMSGGYSRGGTTVGNVWLYGNLGGSSRLRHETKHADQFAIFGGIRFAFMYGAEHVRSGGNPRRNVFERWAGLHDGGY